MLTLDTIMNNEIVKWQKMREITAQYADILQQKNALNYKKMVISRFFAENILMLLLQFMGLMMGTLVPASLIWAASGVAAAFIFMRGYRILPGIFLGSFFAYFCVSLNLILSFASAFIWMGQIFLFFFVSYYLISPSLIFYQFSHFIKFIISVSIITALSSLLLSMLWTSTLDLWPQWWIADLSGTVIFGCAIVTWDVYFPQMHDLKKINKFFLILSYGLFFVVLSCALFTQAYQIYCLILLIPATLWIGLRYGWCGANAANFLLGMLFCIAAYLSSDLFIPNAGTFQIIVMIESIILLGTAAISKEAYHD